MKHGLSLASVVGAFLASTCLAEVPAPYGQVDATKDDPVLYGRHCKRYTDANPSMVSFTTPASSYSFAAWVCPENVSNRGRGKCAFANIHYWAVPLTDEEVARDYQHPGLMILVR